MNHQLSALRCESLESRELLAGNVTVVEDGHLFVRGDELSNQIAIVADESGQITISGLSGTTINGSSEPYQVRESIGLDGARGRNALYDGGLRVMTYGGHNRVDVQGTEWGAKSRILTGDGDDRVRFIKSTSRHDLRTVTGTGHDTLNFVQTRVHGDFEVNTAAGEDSIRVRNSRTWGTTAIMSGAGSDAVTLDKVRLTGDQHRVKTSSGADQIVIRRNEVNEAGLDIFAGAGSDHVVAEMTENDEVTGEVTIVGQSGFDVLESHADAAMREFLNERGFVEDTAVEGTWFVYDRGEEMPEPQFNYRATAVTFEEATQVESIDWIGSYFNSIAPETDDFVIEIFESEAVESHGGGYWFRQPEWETATRFRVGNQANRVDTGVEWSEQTHDPGLEIAIEGATRKIYSYSAELDFEFLADQTYWISIYAYREAPEQRHSFHEHDFGVLLDFPGRPDELREYVNPTGTESDPFKNTNAVMFDDNAESGLAPDSWYFSSAAVQTHLILNKATVN